jgi:dihydrofolate reductase
MPLVSLVAALARNRVIGAGNRMPWHLPEDLRRFKRLTMGAPVIMGRKTYESILEQTGRPLPGRRNIVVTRQPGARWDGCEVAGSLDAALAAAHAAPEVFVIGGAELYRLALPRADRLYLTLLDAEYPGDTLFPEFDAADWRETARAPRAGFAFVTYERARPGS